MKNLGCHTYNHGSKYTYSITAVKDFGLITGCIIIIQKYVHAYSFGRPGLSVRASRPVFGRLSHGNRDDRVRVLRGLPSDHFVHNRFGRTSVHWFFGRTDGMLKIPPDHRHHQRQNQKQKFLHRVCR